MPGLAVVAARLLVPAWLLVMAGLQIADGTTDVLPIWMKGMAVRVHIEPTTALRILLGLELLFAGWMLLLGRWSQTLAIGAMAFACFSAIASISAAPDNRQAVLVSAVVLVISGLLLLLLLRGEKRPAAPLSIQWQAIGALAVAVISSIIAIQVPMRLVDESIRGTFRPKRPLEVVELDFANGVGKPFADSGIRSHMPKLVAAALDGRSYVIFYNPRCGSCHDLFREHFQQTVDGKILAVRIPAAPDELLLPSDQPDEVECPQCTFYELPGDRVWQLEPRVPPIVVVVDDGIVTCVGVECLAPGGHSTAEPPPPTLPSPGS